MSFFIFFSSLFRLIHLPGTFFGSVLDPNVRPSLIYSLYGALFYRLYRIKLLNRFTQVLLYCIT